MQCYRQTHINSRMKMELKARHESGNSLLGISNGEFLATTDQAVLRADLWLRMNEYQITSWLAELDLLEGAAAENLQRLIFTQTTLRADKECLNALTPPSIKDPLRDWVR